MNKRTKLIWGMAGLIVVGCAAFFLLIQVLPIGGGRTNPPVTGEPAWDSPRTRQLFMRTCGDCHSNETAWPWYTNVAPVSWLVIHDVQEGRGAFNVSEWGRSPREGHEAAEAFQEGAMPPGMFLIMHPEGRLSAQESQQLLNGLVATFGGEGAGKGEGEEDD